MFFTGLQLLSFAGSTDIEEAAALSYARDVIDVYSNSWGPPDSGFHSRGPRTLTRQVLKEGVTEVKVKCVVLCLI